MKGFTQVESFILFVSGIKLQVESFKLHVESENTILSNFWILSESKIRTNWTRNGEERRDNLIAQRLDCALSKENWPLLFRISIFVDCCEERIYLNT